MRRDRLVFFSGIGLGAVAFGARPVTSNTVDTSIPEVTQDEFNRLSRISARKANPTHKNEREKARRLRQMQKIAAREIPASALVGGREA